MLLQHLGSAGICWVFHLAAFKQGKAFIAAVRRFFSVSLLLAEKRSLFTCDETNDEA